MQLSNGMLALVISDPSEDIASCCVSVAAGHHSDPDDIAGLAHLCEHMLCVSSKKYPSPDLYRTTVLEAGGMINACTNGELTSYYFTLPVTNNGNVNTFEQVLDIFSSNFREPLFNNEDAAREVYAIDNEHCSNVNASNRVSFYGYKLLADSKNQFSRFSTGNFDSLTESIKRYNIQNKLHAFFKENYLPARMTLVIRGPQSVNYLKKTAVNFFSSIGMKTEKTLFGSKTVNKQVEFKTSLQDFSINEEVWSSKYSSPVYTEKSRSVLIQMDNVKSGYVRLGFPVPTKLSNIPSKDLTFLIDFFCNILGDESYGTLALQLTQREYIQSLVTNSSNVTTHTAILEIQLLLTDLGILNFDEVINAVYTYLSLFYKPSAKMVKHLAKSMSQYHGICLYNFLYAEPSSDSALENQNLSGLMMSKLSDLGRWINTGCVVYDEFTESFEGAYNETPNSKDFWIAKANQFINFVTEFLNPSNMIMTFTGDVSKLRRNSSLFKSTNDILIKDKFYEFDYLFAKIDSNFTKPNPINYNLQMDIPLPNQFAPKITGNQKELLSKINETVEASANSSLGYSIKNTGSQGKPRLIYHDDSRQLWIKRETDIIFNDKGLLTVMLTPTSIVPTLKLISAIEIMISCLVEKLSNYLYPAMLLNYSFAVLPSTKVDGGIIIHVSGPKDSIGKVLQIIVNQLKATAESFDPAVTVAEFERQQRKSFISLENIYEMPSCILSMIGLYASLEENIWPLEARIESAKTITKLEVSQYVKNLFESCYMSSLLQGDISVDEYQDIITEIDKLVKHFNSQHTKSASSVLLPDNSNFKIHSHTQDASNVITYFIQTNLRKDLKQRSIAKFVTYIMSITLAIKLRGEYQLGYIVQVEFKSTRKTQGVCITIVNSSYNSETLDKKIDMVLMEWFNQYFINNGKNQEDFKCLVNKFIANEQSPNALTKSSPSLSMDMLGLPGGDRPIVAQHKSFWEQISTNVYAFGNKPTGEEFIDTELIKTLTFDYVSKYIQMKILPKGIKRAKISILLDSLKPKEHLKTTDEAYKLFTWLGSMGLPIKYEDFTVLAHQSGGSKIVFGKNLFKYYKSKGKSVTLITGVLATLSKSIMFSLSSGDYEVEQIPAVEVSYDDIENWRKKIGYVNDPETLNDALAKLRI